MVSNKYDKIIIGAGIYGLYSAIFSGKKGESVLIIEKENSVLKRATYINQARVHMGYHYPRSYSTAIKSANYFERFVNDYPEAIHSDFNQIYGTASSFSWTNKEQFIKFCRDSNIKCEELPVNKYFKNGQCDGAYLTKEYTYDAMMLKDLMLNEITSLKNVEIMYETTITEINKKTDVYEVSTDKGIFTTPFLLNATYASINQVLEMLGYEKLKIKYELCEIILCKINEELKEIGLTVMDGPFFFYYAIW